MSSSRSRGERLCKLLAVLCLTFGVTALIKHRQHPHVSQTTEEFPQLPPVSQDVKHAYHHPHAPKALPAARIEDRNVEDQEESYETSVARGCRLYGILLSTDPEPPQSTWTNWDEIENYGWTQTVSIDPDIALRNFNPPLLLSVSQGGIGSTDPHRRISSGTIIGWHNYDISRATYQDPDGQLEHYNPTFGYYDLMFYPEQGIIISKDTLSPPVAAEEKHRRIYRGGPIIPLSRWSDMTFLEWQHQCLPAEVPNLKYVIRANILNQATLYTIFQALENVGETNGPLAWPGTEFTMDMEEGKALLGTPNGGGIAWLLAQHRVQLGHRIVTSVVVFENDLTEAERPQWKLNSRPSLLFTIGSYGGPAAGRVRGVKRKPSAPTRS